LALTSLEKPIFYKDATQTGTGLEYPIYTEGRFMWLGFATTEGTTFNAQIEVQSELDVWFPYYALKIPTFDILTDITSSAYLYKINVEGINKVRVKITSITGKITLCQGRLLS
jgi:hypothetical protein